MTSFAICVSKSWISPSSVIEHWSYLPVWGGTIKVVMISLLSCSIPARIAQVSILAEVLRFERCRKWETISSGQTTVRSEDEVFVNGFGGCSGCGG
jgi:hypothetical protein